jgi:hypothetical protein
MKRNPVWNEYVQCMSGYPIEMLLIRKAIEEAGLVGTTADKVENDIWFLIDDKAIAFSWKAWGDLMQAIVGKREGYMRYYS